MYAFRNKCVFNNFLKALTVLASLMFLGRLFQSLGAAAAKARSPKVFKLVFGMTSRYSFSDLNGRAGVCLVSNCERYSGAVPLRVLYVPLLVASAVLLAEVSQSHIFFHLELDVLHNFVPFAVCKLTFVVDHIRDSYRDLTLKK